MINNKRRVINKNKNENVSVKCPNSNSGPGDGVTRRWASRETKRWTLGVRVVRVAGRQTFKQREVVWTSLEPGFDASSSPSTATPHTPPPLATYTHPPAPYLRPTQPPTHVRSCGLCMRLLELLRGGDGGLVRVFYLLEVVEENNDKKEERGETRECEERDEVREEDEGEEGRKGAGEGRMEESNGEKR